MPGTNTPDLKPGQHDPRAPCLIKAILERDAYRLADEGIAVPREGATRGLRRQLDCLKAEPLPEAHRIRAGISIMG